MGAASRWSAMHAAAKLSKIAAMESKRAENGDIEAVESSIIVDIGAKSTAESHARRRLQSAGAISLSGAEFSRLQRGSSATSGIDATTASGPARDQGFCPPGAGDDRRCR